MEWAFVPWRMFDVMEETSLLVYLMHPKLLSTKFVSLNIQLMADEFIHHVHRREGAEERAIETMQAF